MLKDVRMDGQMDERTDRWTNGRTDRPSYRDARMHLKKKAENFKKNIKIQTEHKKKAP